MATQYKDSELHWHISQTLPGDFATDEDGKLLYFVTSDGLLYEATYCEEMAGKPAVMLTAHPFDDMDEVWEFDTKEQAMRHAEMRYKDTLANG